MRKPKVYWRALRREWSRDGWEPTDTGWFLTLTILMVLLKIGLLEDCSTNVCSSKFDQFLRLKPSEMGDTLAGFFSALAFIWIIVTVFIQSRELREQRKEFIQQRKATQNMAKAMATQASIFQDEQRQRYENRSKELLDELLVSLRTLMVAQSNEIRWKISRVHRVVRNPFEGTETNETQESKVPLFKGSKGLSDSTEIAYFNAQYKHLEMLNGLLPDLQSPDRILASPSPSLMLSANGLLNQITIVFDELSEAQKERVKNLAIFGLKTQLDQLAEKKSLGRTW